MASQCQPLITFVGYARNDNYAANFLDRLQLTIRTLAQQAADFRISIEFLLVEWNPPAEGQSLADVLAVGGDNPYFRCTVITVPPAYHSGFVGADEKGFHPSRALNVGYRRAQGQFVSPLSSDVILTDAVFDYISHQGLDETCVYRLDRYDVETSALPAFSRDRESRRTMQKNLGRQVIHHHDNHGTHIRDIYGIPDLHTNACGDFLLAPNWAWQKIHGVPEDCDVTCLDIDSIALHALVFAGCRQVILPDSCRLYKFTHPNAGYRQRVKPLRYGWRKWLEKAINTLVPGRWNKATLRGLCNVPIRQTAGMKFASDSFEKNFILRVKKWYWFQKDIALNPVDWGLVDVDLKKKNV